MGRIEKTFERLKADGRSALIPFITAGDPSPATTVAVMHALVEGGSDVIELGVPFSDPMADGPVIQRSSERALKHGVTLRDVLRDITEFRIKDETTPVVIFGYANPIERMGQATFAAAARDAGADGVLVVDYPPEESEEWTGTLAGAGLAPIFLLSPTSSDERIERVARMARGYIYYVSLKGVTGAANIDTTEVAAAMQRIRAKTALPVGVGFGIRDGETARRIGELADAVVVGSRLVQDLSQVAPEQAANRAREVAAEFRSAMDAVVTPASDNGIRGQAPAGAQVPVVAAR